MKNKSVTAIILVAGNSTRSGQNRNKNFEVINGKEILFYSLEKFNNNKFINDIIIACKKDEIEKIKEIVSKINTNKKISFVIGGHSRKESVYNCLKETKADIVIIHDGARPMIQDRFITQCIEEMDNFKGVTIGVKSKDTIKITDDNGIVEQTTIRKNTWLIQTPQCFHRDKLLEMHEKFEEDESITDDCMLMERNGEKIKLIEGEYSNIKITTFDDINLIKAFLNK